jgi:Family of unknown function (DUF5519)
MKLKDKGPIVKPPTLKGPSQNVSIEIQSWPQVISATHWTIGDSTKPNGADFYVNESELGHIHLNGEIHIKLTKRLTENLISARLAESFPWGADWIQFKIANQNTAEHAKWLFRLGYDRLSGMTDADLKL